MPTSKHDCDPQDRQGRLTDPLEAKLRQLLGFYQTQLPDAWQALLGVVALFPDRVAVDTAVGLSRQLPGVAQRLDDVSDAQLRGALATLAADGLLTRELDPTGQELYACHPVTRGHFRSALVGSGPGVAAEAAGLLTGATSGTVGTIEELGMVTNAIGLLLDAGELKQADSLYFERMGSEPTVFATLPAPREGVRCALGFVADQYRCDQVRHRLSVRRLSFYLNEVGLYARQAAEFELADRFLRHAVEIKREIRDDALLSQGLMVRSALLLDLGRLADTEATAREALDLARRAGEVQHERNALGWLGSALGLQGQMTEAVSAFEAATNLERRIDTRKTWLYGFRGVRWSGLLMRLGHTTDARTIMEANLVICERNKWQDEVARCYWLLGCLDALAGADAAAAAKLTKAEVILRGAHQLSDLSQVLLAQADLDRRRQVLDDAERRVEEALAIVSSRRMTLHFADALVLRGHIHLDRGHAEQALDDAEGARLLAQRSGYAWAERDAALVCADAYTALRVAERARDARRQAEQLTHRIQLVT
jgi:tetratricopeptide (TPR) repeat protein